MYTYIRGIIMNMLQAQGFVLVSKHSSFAEAARILNIHQQNFNVFMRKLEDIKKQTDNY